MWSPIPPASRCGVGRQGEDGLPAGGGGRLCKVVVVAVVVAVVFGVADFAVAVVVVAVIVAVVHP